MRALAVCLLLPLALAGCRPATRDDAPREVAVAAASDLNVALEEVNTAFRRAYPDVAVTATYSSSGNIFAQVSNGAPYDVYFSADRSYPDRLVEAGLADGDSAFVYAIGHLVVWVPAGSEVDVERLGARALEDGRIRKIAIANPEHAPYGRAARDALQSLGVWDSVRSKIVFGENVAQTAQFVQSGAADAAVISLSLALSPAMRDTGAYWPVPLDTYPLLEQGAVVLSRARDREAARLYLDFVRTGGREILERYGFSIPH
jgi:molybdate transport system substrate-binding protein